MVEAEGKAVSRRNMVIDTDYIACEAKMWGESVESSF
jgi:hypothetical protein